MKCTASSKNLFSENLRKENPQQTYNFIHKNRLTHTQKYIHIFTPRPGGPKNVAMKCELDVI